MADAPSLGEIAQSRTPFSAWLGVILLFILFGAIVLVVIGPSPRGTDYEQKRAQARMEKLKALHAEEAKALTSYAWVDKGKGVVRIPIERAMELTVTQLSQEKPTMAGPIATPPPAPAPVAPGKATPAPGATATPQPAGTAKPTSVEGPKSEIRGQPAGAANPAPVPPGTQPGPSATPAASPASPAIPPVTPPPLNPPTPPGTPLPVPGKSPVGLTATQ